MNNPYSKYRDSDLFNTEHKLRRGIKDLFRRKEILIVSSRSYRDVGSILSKVQYM